MRRSTTDFDFDGLSKQGVFNLTDDALISHAVVRFILVSNSIAINI